MYDVKQLQEPVLMYCVNIWLTGWLYGIFWQLQIISDLNCAHVFIGLYEIPIYWNFSSQCIAAVLHEILLYIEECIFVWSLQLCKFFTGNK
jgi:hypothetical protein